MRGAASSNRVTPGEAATPGRMSVSLGNSRLGAPSPFSSSVRSASQRGEEGQESEAGRSDGQANEAALRAAAALLNDPKFNLVKALRAVIPGFKTR